MLADAAVERYSRQILLPEVGGRGQARLGASHVSVAGDGPVAAVARDLLARAGVHVGPPAAPADVRVDVTGTPERDGRPLVIAAAHGVDAWPTPVCAACAPPAAPRPADDGPLAAPAALAHGALLAAEALMLLLGIRTAPRRQTIDLAAGVLGGTTLAPRPGCACTSAT